MRGERELAYARCHGHHGVLASKVTADDAPVSALEPGRPARQHLEGLVFPSSHPFAYWLGFASNFFLQPAEQK